MFNRICQRIKKSIMKYSLFWLLFLCTVVLISVHACTSNPILVEIPGAPIPNNPEDTIIGSAINVMLYIL
ncbi:MAG: hypothetical protein ACI85O_000987 [Saprospiraceae bacterium]|jgi:hypothetical protein